jgi:hypothetical protein
LHHDFISFGFISRENKVGRKLVRNCKGAKMLSFGSFGKILKETTILQNDAFLRLVFGSIVNVFSMLDPDQSKLLNSKLDIPVWIQNKVPTILCFAVGIKITFLDICISTRYLRINVD